MYDGAAHERTIRDIGHEIFELARAAQPRVWNRMWWLERITQWIDCNQRLKTRAFQFVDCLPSLRTDEAIARHLLEYLDRRYVSVPPILQAILAPGPLYLWRQETVARAARYGAVQMAGRFVTGYDVPSAIRTIQRLRQDGMAFTLDVLGESTTSYAQADRYAKTYEELIDRLTPLAAEWDASPILDEDERGPTPRVNLSIKLTGLDPHCDAIDPARTLRELTSRLRPLLRRARQCGAFVNIDMESYKHRLLTLELFQSLLMEEEFRDWTHVGIVVQAYLKEGEQDLYDLLEWGARRGARFAIRLVKGAYWDAETAAAVRSYREPPVWTQKWQSDACFERMARTMLESRRIIRPAFASHNVRSLAFVLATARALGLTPRHYELQMLYGMGDPLKHALVALGQCVRVYCPYGELMPGMSYLIRRLLENTSNDSFLKQSFAERGSHEALLVDPARTRPPSSSLPARLYQDSEPEEAMLGFKNASDTNFALAANRDKMKAAIAYVRGELGREYPGMIDHEPVPATEWFESHNPSNPAETVGKVALSTRADGDRAVAAARRAFSHWRVTPPPRRASILRAAAERLEARRFELAATMILEVGKPWRQADADVTEAVDHCRYYAEQIERIEARPRLRNLPGEDNKLVYTPKGVCAVISPWPFPLAILTGMTTAALAAGNTVVVKPARQASVTAAKFVEILAETGIPPGAVNLLPGQGSVVGAHLAEHEEVNIVAFTGSHTVGTQVLRGGAVVRPGQALIRKMIVEMGGKNAIIIDDDADLDGAVQAVIESAFGFAGQKCSSCSRLIVVGDVYDSFCARLVEAVESIIVGPAEEPSTMTGPVIDAEAKDRLMQEIDAARNSYRLLAQAPLSDAYAAGFFVPPTVIADVPADSPLAQTEILGPLLALTRVRDFDDAIRIANHSRFALTGGVFSRSPAHIELAKQEFQAGNLYINRRITGSQVDAQPFGGFKLSGTGVKAGSPDYLLHFMDARCITENTLRSGLVPTEAVPAPS